MRRRPEEEHIWGGAGPSFQNIYRWNRKEEENNNKKEMAHHFKMCTIKKEKKKKKNNEIVNYL